MALAAASRAGNAPLLADTSAAAGVWQRGPWPSAGAAAAGWGAGRCEGGSVGARERLLRLWDIGAELREVGGGGEGRRDALHWAWGGSG